MGKMLVYSEDRIDKIVNVSLHFDDTTIESAEIREGDTFACQYLHKKYLVAVQGRVLEIFSNRFGQTTLKMDVSTENRSAIIFVVTNNIRKFLPLQPSSFLQLLIDFNKETDRNPRIIGDGVVDTVDEIVEQLEWKE